MFEREESRHDFAFLAGVLVGALAGAAATLALTPMSGSETRDKLRAQTSNLNVNVGDLKQRAGDLAGAAGTRVAPVRERVSGLASKTPLPLGRKADTLADADTSDASDTAGASRAHAEAPAEGRDDIGNAGTDTTLEH
jgi:gas vesicle protein